MSRDRGLVPKLEKSREIINQALSDRLDAADAEALRLGKEVERLRKLLRTIAENEFACSPYIDYRAIWDALEQKK